MLGVYVIDYEVSLLMVSLDIFFKIEDGCVGMGCNGRLELIVGLFYFGVYVYLGYIDGLIGGW